MKKMQYFVDEISLTKAEFEYKIKNKKRGDINKTNFNSRMVANRKHIRQWDYKIKK